MQLIESRGGMKSRACPMLVGMVTWPGERQSERDEGEGTFVSGEEPISSSSAAGCSVSPLPSVLLWRKRTLLIKDTAAAAGCFYPSQPHVHIHVLLLLGVLIAQFDGTGS